MSENNNSPSDYQIPKERVAEGAFVVLENTTYFLDRSKKLYHEKEFQLSIVLSTISIEESLKGIELSINSIEAENLSGEKME